MPFIDLPSKEGAKISYDYFAQPSPILVVFLNGLALPAAGWKPVVSILQTVEELAEKPSLLTYDRYGQGATTTRDPLDEQPGKDPGYGHDFMDVTKDLYELIQVVTVDNKPERLVLVANSVGAHVARLFAQYHPDLVAGILILDANIGNKELFDLWPNPEPEAFDQSGITANECTFEQYAEIYTKLSRMFNSDVMSPEGLDRRGLKALLPLANEPKLKGPDGKGIWLTVVGHDPIAFAEESFRLMKVPQSLIMRFTQPAWEEYNKGLASLTELDRSAGPIIAPGCGHFIQKDNPKFVAEQIIDLLTNMESTA